MKQWYSGRPERDVAQKANSWSGTNIYRWVNPEYNQLYDRANIDGTRNTVELANAIGAGCLHHVSSIAVAGRYRGRFTESMFDEGQELDHPYFRTKHAAEAIVRSDATVPYRIYRPGMVIGSSETGEADRVDGPYYAFKLIQRLRDSFPQWMPFAGPEGGELNLVPVAEADRPEPVPFRLV